MRRRSYPTRERRYRCGYVATTHTRTPGVRLRDPTAWIPVALVVVRDLDARRRGCGRLLHVAVPRSVDGGEERPVELHEGPRQPAGERRQAQDVRRLARGNDA